MRRIWIFSLFLLVLMVGGCVNRDRTLSFIQGEDLATPNGATLLEVITKMEDYRVEWIATDGGSFHRTDEPQVVWKAPSQPGKYLVEVQVIGDFFTEVLPFSIQVVDEPSLKIRNKRLIIRDGIKKAIIAFENNDALEREILDFKFYMVLFDEENYQGNRLSYHGRALYEGRPNKEEHLPILYGDIYDQDEWDLRWASETESILPWVYHLEFTTGEVWNLYQQD